jgi:hypothetical protein
MPLSSFEPIVILPQEHVKWLIDQPATVLCPRTAAVQRMGFKYVSPDFDAQSSEIIHAAIRFHLNKKFDKLQGDMFKEMQWATDSRIGTDESWNEVNLADAMRYIIFHTLVPVLAGQSLSRNEDFTHALMKSANWVGAGSIIVGQFVPVPFRSALGRLLQIPIRYTQGSFLNHLMPVFKERFQNMRKKVEDPSYSFEAPEDMTTWLSDVILKRKNIDEGAEKAFENAYKLLVRSLDL